MPIRPLSEKSIKMNINITYSLIISLILLLSFVSIIQAQEIVVTGSWTETIDVTDLQGGPGSDLVDTYESATDQVEIEIKGKKTKDWRVDVSKGDTHWHADFMLSVKRTADGIGSGGISGGTAYQEVTSVDTEFFTGGKNRKNVTIQIKLSNVSANIPTDTYSTTVYYTVIGI